MPTHNKIYVASPHTKKIFRNMRRVGKGFSGRETPLFQTMMVQDQAEMGEDNVADEAVNEEMDDNLVRAVTTATSLDVKQDRGNINKTQSKATLNEPCSSGTGSGSGPRCQETMRDTIAQTRFENVSKLSNDPLLARGYTLRSGEDSLKLQELMALCITLQSRVLNLETTKTTQANEIASLKRRVKKLEKKNKLRTHKLKDYTSSPTTNVADEAVYEEMDDSLERPATTATSLDAEQDRGNINKTQSKATLNEPSSPETSLGSGHRRQETMGHTIAQTWSENVSKHSNDPLLARAEEITSLKLRVKNLEKKGRSRTHKLKRLYKVGRSARMVSSDEASLGDQEDVSKQGRKINDIDKDAENTLVDETQGRYGDDLMFDTGVLDDEEVFAGHDMAKKEINVVEKEVSTADLVTTASEVVSTASLTKTIINDELTLAQTLIEIKSAKPKVKGVVIGEQSESTKRTRPQQLLSKDKGKGIMEELKKPTKRKDQIRHDEQDNVQAMIDVDCQMAQQMQVEEQEKLSIEEKSKLFVQLLEARKKHFVAMRAKEKRNKPPTKAQKRNTTSTYLKNMAGYKNNQLKKKSFDDIQKLFDKAMKRVNTFVDMDTELVEDDGDDVTIDATPLSTKSPSIMLKNFDREDLEALWSIVKARFKKTEPVNYMDNFLLLNLKTMFEHHVEDSVWKNQQGLVKVLNWKLYDSCGLHYVTMQNILYYLLVEKMYPLTNHTLHQMFNDVKLQVDYEYEMAFELLRLVKKQLKEGYVP
ncbi:hypothetical protein Tco_0563440 [Tanacetum coccineum]